MTTSNTSEIKKKKRMIVSYKKLALEQLALLKNLYPHGFTDSMMKVKGINNEEFNAVMMETDNVQYLVKVEIENTGVVFDDDETTDVIVDDVPKNLIPDIDNDEEEEEPEEEVFDNKNLDEEDEDNY